MELLVSGARNPSPPPTSDFNFGPGHIDTQTGHEDAAAVTWSEGAPSSMGHG